MKNIEINRHQKYYRFFEILPGITTWAIFIFPVWMSYHNPEILMVLVIIYAVYWLLKALVMSTRLIVGYKKYKNDAEKNWTQILDRDFRKNWEDIYHVVIVASYKESYETLKYSFEAIASSQYPQDKIIVVLATEERAMDIGRDNAQKISQEFGNKFHYFLHSEHPKDLPNEVVGKGPNINYAAKKILKYIDKQGINHENVLVTTLDSDHRPHKKYFSALTYSYLSTEDRKHKSYQPIPMFFNNIWDVPIPIRSIAIGSSFWQIIESTRPYRLRNFASHAQSLDALVETNFWSSKTIVEDGHQFWRSYFRFDGNHSVVPINIPVYQDAVLSPHGYIKTFSEQYFQKKRWSWGCSDIPYVATFCIKNKKIPLLEKILQFSRLYEGHISWSTTSIVLFCAGWIPFIINPQFRESLVGFNFPYIYSRILTIAMIGMVVTLTISTLMLPPRPKKSLNWSIILEWIITPFMLPFSNIFFSSIPAVHTQSLLLMGKYMEVFHQTEKKAVKYDKIEKDKA
jgi:cellulose synthase/poly-beta-1,6-N-acetylglucosamine synthase-like glycosyltransferase